MRSAYHFNIESLRLGLNTGETGARIGIGILVPVPESLPLRVLGQLIPIGEIGIYELAIAHAVADI